MSEANVPGFRPGRAPRKLVESHFRGSCREKIKGSLLMDSMTQVTEEQDFSAISEPDFDFDAVEIPDEGPLTFEFDIEVRPEFDLPKWKGLKLEKPIKDFSKKDIDDHLVKLLERHAILEPIEEPAATGRFRCGRTLRSSVDGKRIRECLRTEIRVRPELSFQDGSLVRFRQADGRSQGGRRKSPRNLR